MLLSLFILCYQSTQEKVGNAMKIYRVKYTWKDMIDAIYEYIISNCENIFGVVNRKCTFRIEPDSQLKSLTIGLIHDGDEQEFLDYMKQNNLKDTGLNYVQLLSPGLCAYIEKADKHDYLACHEIRYIKLNYNDIARLLITIVAKQMRLRKFYGVMLQEDSGLYIVYISKTNFEHENINSENAVTKFIDKTADIVEKFM